MATKKKLLQVSGGGSIPWDISNATYNGDLSFKVVGFQETSPTGLSFKPDGTKIYIIGEGSDSINEYNLSTAWDVATATLLQNFSVSSRDGAPSALFFKSDGTKMYTLGRFNDNLDEYNLSTAWDVSTSVWSQALYIGGTIFNAKGLFFKPDGTKAYILGSSIAQVHEYNLSTAWDVSTATYSQLFSVSSQEANATGLFFKDDGTVMYVTGTGSDAVLQYALSTAWDISSASFSTSKYIGSESVYTEDLFFKPDGTKLYTACASTDSIYEYNLSTAWGATSATYTAPTSNYFYYGSQDTSASDLFFSSDGLKMYITGRIGDFIYQYNLSAAWDIYTASYLQGFYIGGFEANPQGTVFKTDGTEMYVIGSSGIDITQFSLSTAWDVSTATYSQSFSVLSQDNVPLGLFLKPDGTKLYVMGSASDAVYEYNLSTAWSVSTATYSQSFSISTQDLVPTSLFFRDDGKKMYFWGNTNKSVYEYDLGTAWDISTATYLQNFSTTDLNLLVNGIFFSNNGNKLYILDDYFEAIFSYDL